MASNRKRTRVDEDAPKEDPTDRLLREFHEETETKIAAAKASRPMEAMGDITSGYEEQTNLACTILTGYGQLLDKLVQENLAVADKITGNQSTDDKEKLSELTTSSLTLLDKKQGG